MRRFREAVLEENSMKIANFHGKSVEFAGTSNKKMVVRAMFTIIRIISFKSAMLFMLSIEISIENDT